MNRKIATWVRPHILELKAYSSARDEFKGTEDQVFLDANESPFNNGVNRYPDPYQKDLKQAIGKLKMANPEQLLLGNGSDEVLDLVMRTFIEPQKDVFSFLGPSYGMYQVLADINNIQMKELPYDEDYDFELDILDQIQPKLMVICNPNNPSGTTIAPQKLENLITRNPNTLFLIDEAYVDFCPEYSMLPLLNQYPNLMICQTFSKAWGAAGLRLGMLWAAPELIQILNKVKAPYNINLLTQKRAMDIIGDKALVDGQIKQILAQRSILEQALKGFDFVVDVLPSQANFILFFTPNANELYDFAIQKGVVLRNRSKQFENKGAIRISIGTPEENQKLLNILKDYEKSIVYR